MSISTAASIAFDGSLALTPARPKFRVIEGGRAKSASKCADAARSYGDHVEQAPKPAARVADMAMRQSSVARATVSGRTLFACAMIVIVALAITWVASDIFTQKRIDSAMAGASYETVIVHPGDTIWGFAESHPVDGCSTAELVQEICDLNSLDDASLVVGTTLSIPYTD